MRTSMAAVLVLAVLAASAQADGVFEDASWTPGFSWDSDIVLEHGMPAHPTNTDPLPPAQEGVAQPIEEEAFVGDKLARAKAHLANRGLAPSIDCDKAHVANQYACDAYGEHSPVCTGSQMKYLRHCGTWEPRSLYSKTAYSGASTADTSLGASLLQEEETDATLQMPDEGAEEDPGLKEKEAAEKNAPEIKSKKMAVPTGGNSTVPKERNLQSDLEPVLMHCQNGHDTAKMACKRDVASGYIKFREANPVEEDEGVDKPAGTPEGAESVNMMSDLGSAKEVERVYGEAMQALRAHKARTAMGALPSVSDASLPSLPEPSLAMEAEASLPVPTSFESTKQAAKFAQQDELFDEMDPTHRDADVEAFAAGEPFLKK